MRRIDRILLGAVFALIAWLVVHFDLADRIGFHVDARTKSVVDAVRPNSWSI